MNDVRAPNHELAFEDYQKGAKYKAIAEKYEVTVSAVKSWASRYWKNDAWVSEHTRGCNPKKSRPQKVATRGGQPGNKNAVGNGGGAPENNKNAVKTGEFETLFFDALEEDEKRLADMIRLDKERLLLQEIQLLTIRERRMLKRIDALKRAEEQDDNEPPLGMTVVKVQQGIEKGKRTDLKEYAGILGQIQSVEDALTRVQARKQKAIDSLHRYGFDDARLELETMKFEIEITKQGGDAGEAEDDGFMDAMNAAAGEVWTEDDV